MKIFASHPDYRRFIENEIDTINHIKTRRKVFKEYPDLLQAIDNAHLKYYKYKNQVDSFEFYAKCQMEVDGRDRNVIIGANLANGFSKCSYCLAITEGEDPEVFVRKFHFDYAVEHIPTKSPVPSYHLQYGGETSGEMAKIDAASLNTKLSLPRIGFTPMNLALLIDLVFCEFRTKETAYVVELPEWRQLIHDNEFMVLSGFYEVINDHFKKANRNWKYLLRDLVYNTQVNP